MCVCEMPGYIVAAFIMPEAMRENHNLQIEICHDRPLPAGTVWNQLREEEYLEQLVAFVLQVCTSWELRRGPVVCHNDGISVNPPYTATEEHLQLFDAISIPAGGDVKGTVLEGIVNLEPNASFSHFLYGMRRFCCGGCKPRDTKQFLELAAKNHVNVYESVVAMPHYTRELQMTLQLYRALVGCMQHRTAYQKQKKLMHQAFVLYTDIQFSRDVYQMIYDA